MIFPCNRVFKRVTAFVMVFIVADFLRMCGLLVLFFLSFLLKIFYVDNRSQYGIDGALAKASQFPICLAVAYNYIGVYQYFI